MRPPADPARRRALLDELRCRQIAEAAAHTPAERIAQLIELYDLACAMGTSRSRHDGDRDAWIEGMRAMKARMRRADGR